MLRLPLSHRLAALGLAVAASAALLVASGGHATEAAMDGQPMDHAAMGPAAPPQVAAVPNQVVIDNFAFAPKTLTVDAGTEVVWVNHDDEPHTVVYSGEAKLFKSPALDTDDKFSFVFKAPGTYNYYCSIHPHMTATIVVK